MIEKIKYAIISDIYVKDLKFYNKDKELELAKFCNQNGISFLPCADRKTCYKFINNTFVQQDLTDDLICKPYDRLFDEQTLEKFKMGNHDEVLFVMENDLIKGVVHIVDYNNDFINIEFFKATLSFEKMLRRLLELNGETNDTLLEWMNMEKINNKHWERRYFQLVPKEENKRKIEEIKRFNTNQFQCFYLNDLLSFAVSKKHLSEMFDNNLKAITQIRNWVAHNKDITHKNYRPIHPLYNMDGLKEFVSNSALFFDCYEELEISMNKLLVN